MPDTKQIIPILYHRRGNPCGCPQTKYRMISEKLAELPIADRLLQQSSKNPAEKILKNPELKELRKPLSLQTHPKKIPPPITPNP